MEPKQPDKITSAKNPRIQFVRSLLSDKSARTETGLFITEGVRLAEEVISAGIIPQTIFFSEQTSDRCRHIIDRCLQNGVEAHEISLDVMNKISDTETAQGILMVVPQTSIPVPPAADLVLILDQLRDPGNCGTILRTAAAAGVKLIFNTPGSADLFMPKVVRSGMGAHFRMCIRQTGWENILNYCKPSSGIPLHIFLAESSGGKNLWDSDLKSPLALVIGGEADGASSEGRKAADSLIHIPMPGQFESLNAGVAASILLFEIVRQRTL